MDYEIEQACDPEANGGDEQTIDRIGKRLCEGNGKIEQRGHGHAMDFVAEENTAQLLENQNQTESEQYLIKMIASV